MIAHKRFDELLNKLKVILAMNDNDQNEYFEKILEFSLTKVIQNVANYLNTPVDELPEELDYTLISMTAQMINSHELLVPADSKNNGIQSLSEGDTSVTFKDPAAIYLELQNVNSVSDNYVSILNNFRRLPQ